MKRAWEDLTPSERELLEFCDGDINLLRVALRGAIRARTRKIAEEFAYGLVTCSQSVTHMSPANKLETD
ncbi:hypothetical protein YM18_1691 [Geobacter sulfurreducens]|nr:hypothetical protein YM18_1691 [Geobacter sulfurreducens]